MGTVRNSGGREQAPRKCLASLLRTLPGPEYAPALRRFVFLYLLDHAGWLPYAPGRLWQLMPADTSSNSENHGHFDREVLRPTARRWLGATVDAGLPVPDTLCRTWLQACDAWEWTLAEDPGDERIGPALLGALCEREQDRKGQGVYFTSPDVTRYICGSVLVPAVLDRFAAALGLAAGAFSLRDLPGWRAPHSPDRYLPPTRIQPDPLPHETEQERRERQVSVAECRRSWVAGEIATSADFITWNLDLSRLVLDWIAGCGNPEAIRRFLQDALCGFKVLDPTCGSGAFLLGALEVLRPLYFACLDRLRQLAPEAHNAPASGTLDDGSDPAEPTRRGASQVTRLILERNLYGVDLSSAAIETCRMRLLLRFLADTHRLPPSSAAETPPVVELSLHLQTADVLTTTAPWPQCPEEKQAFDAVVGNPPYVAYAPCGQYHGLGYTTEGCENLYALVCERARRLAGPEGRLGLIVPISSVSLPGFRPLAGLLREQACWISTYSNRPAKLFPGVEQRLAIWITGPAPGPTTHVSPYQHWHEPERPHLFDRLRYTPASEWPETGMPIKSGHPVAESLFRKLLRHRGRLTDLTGEGEGAVWLHDGPTYWIRALAFPPNPGAPRTSAGHYHRIPAPNCRRAHLLAALLSSTAFYFFFKMVSNCRDLGRKEWASFPLDPLPIPLQEELGDCGERLAERLQATARTRTRRYPSGTVEYREYYPAQAKEVLDAIDRLLAGHYGFTAEEQDYLLHYDEKYRMGQQDAG